MMEVEIGPRGVAERRKRGRPKNPLAICTCDICPNDPSTRDVLRDATFLRGHRSRQRVREKKAAQRGAAAANNFADQGGEFEPESAAAQEYVDYSAALNFAEKLNAQAPAGLDAVAQEHSDGDVEDVFKLEDDSSGEDIAGGSDFDELGRHDDEKEDAADEGAGLEGEEDDSGNSISDEDMEDDPEGDESGGASEGDVEHGDGGGGGDPEGIDDYAEMSVRKSTPPTPLLKYASKQFVRLTE